MEAVLLVIHLIVAIGIVAVILVQPSESGGFMGSTGAMSNLMMQRRSGDALTKATTILAALFFLTSLALAVVAGNRPVAKSILDVETEPAKKAERAIDTAPDAPVAGVEKKTETAPAPVPVEEPKPTKKPK